MMPSRSLAAPLCALLLAPACGPQSANNDSSTSDDASTGATTSTTSTTDPTTTTSTDPTTTTSTTSATTDPTTTATTGPTVCTAPPLTDDQVDQLAFGIFGNAFEAMPGGAVYLEIGLLECCYTVEPVDACVEYTLSPSEGATYDLATKLLTIDPDVPAGAVYTLTADIESGRAAVAATVDIYTAQSNPLVGRYRELTQLPCGGGAEVPAMPAIGELSFTASGEFNVTWEPFEIYVDYWGTYAYDLDAGTVSLKVDGGNYVPPDVDGEGTFKVENNQLILKDIWLGSAQNFMGPPACGHRFE